MQRPTDASWFESLPGVVVWRVLEYLDCVSVVRAASAHPRWHALIKSDRLWRELYLLRWQQFSTTEPSRYTFESVASPLSIESPAASTDEPREWKGRYIERHVVERNWRTGRALITTLNGHSGTVTCLQFTDAKLVRTTASLSLKTMLVLSVWRFVGDWVGRRQHDALVALSTRRAYVVKQFSCGALRRVEHSF